MCQAYLEMVSPACSACGGGYLAGLDNWISHAPDCEKMKGAVLIPGLDVPLGRRG